MGGGKGPKAPGPSPAETTSARIAEQVYQQTDPLRQGFLQEYGKLFGYVPSGTATAPPATGLGGKPLPGQGATGPSYQRTGESYDPSTSPLYKPMYDVARAGAGTAYKGAKEAILSNTPRGGGQTAALSNLEYQNAKDISLIPAQLSQDIISDMLNKAYGMATGAPQTALSGLGISANAAAMRQQAAAQQQAGTNSLKGSLGMGVGLLGAAALTGGGSALGKGAGAGSGTLPYGAPLIMA